MYIITIGMDVGCWNKDTVRRKVLQTVYFNIGHHWYISLLTTTNSQLTNYMYMRECQLQIASWLKSYHSSFIQIWNYLTKSGWRSRYGVVWELSPLSLSWLWCSGASKPGRFMWTMYSLPLTLPGVIGASLESSRISVGCGTAIQDFRELQCHWWKSQKCEGVHSTFDIMS